MAKYDTLQEELAHRKYKKCNKFVYWFLNKFVVNLILAPKYNPTYNIVDDINKEEGPAFVVYNHQSRMDYIYCLQATYPRRLNFVTGYNEFFRSHLRGILKTIQNIPKKNFNTDIAAMRAMNSIIKQNGVVCIAPEGMSSITGHNQPVALGTGKLFKHYNIPVYMCKLKGSYLTNNKICLDERKGRVDVEFVKLFTPEDLSNMSPDMIEDRLNESLWQDDYEWNKMAKVKYNTNGRICTHLHDICYKCPRCGEEFKMNGEKDFIRCNSCGNGATMDDFYEFHPLKANCVIPESPSKWVDYERKVVYKEIKDNPNYEFVFHCRLGKIPEDHIIKNKATSELCGEGKFTINHEGIFYKGTKDEKPFEFKLEYRLTPTIGMPTDVTYFALYVDGKYYDIFPDEPVVGKVLLLVEEMHRLHVNTWKNFPWMDTYDVEESKKEEVKEEEVAKKEAPKVEANKNTKKKKK